MKNRRSKICHHSTAAISLFLMLYVSSGVSSPAEGDMGDLLARYSEAADALMNKKLTEMNKLLSSSSYDDLPKQRHRRGVPRTFARPENDILEFQGISNFASLGIPFFNDVEVVSYDGYLIASVVTGRKFDQLNHTEILKIYENGTVNHCQTLDSTSWEVHDIGLFLLDQGLYLIMAGDIGAFVLEFDSATEQFEQIQHIYAENAFLVEMFEIDGVAHVAVATTGTVHAEPGEEAITSFYRWEGAHFDSFFSLSTPYVMDICPFVIHGYYYMAIALRDATNVYPDQSIVLRYDLHLNDYRLDQYIDTYGAQDWEFFTISEGKDQEHFLLLAGDLPDETGVVKSVIYKYIWHQFVTFQCIYETAANQWHAITENNDILLILSTNHGIVFYQYDGWRFSPLPIQTSEPVLLSPICSFAAVELNNITYLAVASLTELEQSSNYNIFKVNFNFTNPLGDFQATLEIQCQDLKRKQFALAIRVEMIKNDLSSLVYLEHNETQNIRGSITFLGNASAANVTTQDVIAFEGHIFNASEQLQFDDIVNQTNLQTKQIANLEDRVNQTMKVVGSQVVTDTKSFDSIASKTTLSAAALVVTSDLINSHINLTDLDMNIFRKDENQTLLGPITMNGNLFLDNLEVTGLVDNMNTSKLITLDGNHTISQPVGFGGAVNFTSDVYIDGMTDGINISADRVLLISGDQVLKGSLLFMNQVHIDESAWVDGLVNGWNLSKLQEDAIYKYGNHTVSGINTFQSDVMSLEGVSLDQGKTVDDVDVELLNQTALKTDVVQTITGFYTFTDDVTLEGEMNVTGFVNGLHVPEDVLLANTRDEITISGPLKFTQNLTVTNLTVGTNVDGISYVDGTSLDLLLVSSTDGQVVSGNITFDMDMVLHSHSTINGLVNGIDIKDLADDAVYYEGDFNITGLKTFADPVVFEKDTEVGGTINRENITHVDARALKMSDSSWSCLSQVLFKASKTEFQSSMDSQGWHTFNGISLQDLVIQDINETIEGSKTFMNSIATKSAINFTKLVNGVPLLDFCDDVVMLENNHSIELSGEIRFLEDVTITENLNVSKSVDGIMTEDIVTITGDQIIASSKSFQAEVNIDRFHVNGSIYLGGFINGDNLTEIVEDTLYKHGPQYVSGMKTFADHLTFLNDLYVEGNISSLDLSSLRDDAVYLEGSFNVSGHKTFRAPIGLEHIQIKGTVNDVNFTDFLLDLWLQYDSQSIQGNTSFTNTVTVSGNITITGKVNGYDMQDLKEQVVMVTDDIFSGDLYFWTVFSTGNITVDGLIDNINISGDTLLKGEQNQEVSGLKEFVSPVRVKGRVDALTVNEVNLTELEMNIFMKTGNQTISSQLLFWDGITILKNLTLGGLIDNVDIVKFAGQAWLSDQTGPESLVLNITTNGTFNFINTHNVLYYNGTLDGVDLNELNRTYVSLSKSQDIVADKTFTAQVIVAESANIRAPHIKLDDRINNISFAELSEEAFVSGADQDLKAVLTFEKNVSMQGNLVVDGAVDGVDISRNLMTTNRINIVRSFKNFTGSPLTVEGSLFMKNGKTINGVDVSEWMRHSATTVDNFIIKFDTRLKTVIFGSNIKVDGLLNGVNFSTSYLFTVPHDQRVTGDLIFLKDTNFHGDMTAVTINGIDMVEFATNTLFTSGDFVITSNKTFVSEISFSNITTHGLVGGVRIPILYRRIYTYSDYEAFKEGLDERCDLLDGLYYSQQNAAILFRGLKITQVFEETGIARWYPTMHEGSAWLALTVSPVYEDETLAPDTCGNVKMFSWNSSNYQYNFVAEAAGDLIQDVGFINSEGIFGVVFLEQITDKGCMDITQTATYQSAAQTRHLPTDFPGSSNFSLDSAAHVVMKHAPTQTLYYQQLLGIGSTNVELFQLPTNNKSCIFVANYINQTNGNTVLDSDIYCADNLSLGFSYFQAIPTKGVIKVVHYLHEGDLFLAIANQADSDLNTFEVNSEIWKFSEYDSSFIIVSTATTSAVSDVAVTIVEETTLVAFANEFEGLIDHKDYQQTVDIYKFEDNALELYQQIDIYGPKSIWFTTSRSDNLLLIVDRTDYLHIYKHMGWIAYQIFQSIYVPGASRVTASGLTSGEFHTFVNTYDEENKLRPSDLSTPVAAPQQIYDVLESGSRLQAVGCSVQ